VKGESVDLDEKFDVVEDEIRTKPPTEDHQLDVCSPVRDTGAEQCAMGQPLSFGMRVRHGPAYGDSRCRPAAPMCPAVEDFLERDRP